MEDEFVTLSELDLKFLTTDYEKKIVESVKKANPAVVSIVSVRPSVESDNELFFFEDIMSDDILDSEEMVGGSGFVVSPEGYVVTNRHVVEDNKVDYVVLMNNGERYVAYVLDKDTFLI